MRLNRAFRASVAWLGLIACFSGSAAPSDGPKFPVRISESRRYLCDNTGEPFLYSADTAWMLFLNLTREEASEYIRDRKEKGFTAIQVIMTGFLGMTNRAGHLPFEGKPPVQHFDEPNEEFFRHVEAVVGEAERQGMLLAIAPAWSGCCGEGWAGKEKDGSPKPLDANGPEKSHDLGVWLGKRFAKFANVLWILGGDNDPHQTREPIRQLGLGLKQGAPHQLVTYHAASSHSSTDVWPANEPWLDVSMVYTYFRGFDKAWNKNQPDVYEVSHLEYARQPVRPFFLGESTYEGEHDAWGSAVQARKNAYWCVLGGGCGHAYGSPNWRFPANWREIMQLPGATSLKHFRTVMESRPWWSLVPDVQNSYAVGGRGAFATNDATVSAVAADKSFGISYLPKQRELTLNLSQLKGEPLIAWWFNPRTGETTVAGEFPNEGNKAFMPRGEGDWVLVVGDKTKWPKAPSL